ncbi:MAG: hypothetical protein A2086_16540 [Spirochaetes bacterium GWD1_27_9]|nr:MAG: hypothetical protein A2Y34_09880 [Spirochaetes bacterium GWC1_27_15]OHD29201.1 MAG: hypothetical protein A2086_16540 [Spirochaetes bacterium GWD1_27_9]
MEMKVKTNKILSYVLIIFAVVIWGFSFLSIKVSLVALPPMTLALVRFVIASFVLFLFLRIKKVKLQFQFKDLPVFFVAGFSGITMYFFFENNGIKLTTASNASLIVSIVPILTIIAERIVFKIPLTKIKILSVIISMIGVYLVVGFNTSGGTLIGNLLMIGACFSWLIYSLVTKPLFKKYSQLEIVFYQTIIGTICFIPFVFFEKPNLEALNTTIILNIMFLGIFCSAICYYFYVYAMKQIGIGVSSLFINLIPIITVIASFFILNERIGIIQIIGGILIIFSVYIINLVKNEN